MTDHEPQSQITPEELLRQTASKFNFMYEEAKKTLHIDNNVDLYEEKLAERASLLVNLPKQILQLLEQGQEFPKDEIDYLYTWAHLASEVIESNNTFGMSALLTPWGSKKGEPNTLEKFINRIYPQKSN